MPDEPSSPAPEQTDDAEPLLSKLVNLILGDYDWHRLPVLLGLVKLIPIRNALRRQNLYDLEDACDHADPSPASEDEQQFRTFDGTQNDLSCPHMGAEDTSFGRNFPLEEVTPDPDSLLSPNPRTISRELLTRDSFTPVKILNLLAASWIQFQVHDWFAHKRADDDHHEIPLSDDDPWPHGPMRIEATEEAEPGTDTRPPSYENRNTHWWDGSQIYGDSAETAKKLRTGTDGKMRTGDEALLPLDVEGVVLTGFHDNWWAGLSMLHSLFVAEHNAICDRLKSEYPSWDDERLFQQARLINTALLAKIHTVEWTPAILPHPTVSTALNINWEGIVDEGLKGLFPFLDRNEVLGGIPRSPTNHHGTPYSLTEEFVGVYRMHPLMPDTFSFHSATSGDALGQHTLTEVSLGNTRSIMEQYDLGDLFYSFGIAHPGALRLHNYPNELRSMTRPDGTTLDLAAIDILRDRERGLPRYNDFRAMLRMDRIQSFDELTDDPETAAEIKSVYDGNIDEVDLMVGLFAEPLLDGFGFSETAFRIFILMASRRLKSDRFFTSDFTAERYTEVGLQWIEDNTMLTVLKRHHPELKPALRGVDNAFQPWRSVNGAPQ